MASPRAPSDEDASRRASARICGRPSRPVHVRQHQVENQTPEGAPGYKAHAGAALWAGVTAKA